MTPRFIIGSNNNHALIVDVPLTQYNEMGTEERRKHEIVRLQIGGIMSKDLALTYAEQICEQLNGFDISNATVAKLK